MARTGKLKKVDDKLKKVFKGKNWVKDLNIMFLDTQSVVAFDKLLTEIEMLQRQVQGLEEEIRKIR